MPMTAWTPVPDTAHEIAAERSPSVMSLIRAPASRTSSISDSWRGRSRMTIVMSLTRRPSASAIRPMFSVGLSRMSTLPATTGPTQSFSRYVSGAWVRPPFSDAARTVIAFALAVGDEVRALERIDGDVDLGDVVLVVPADLLADEQHRRLVALALADDDRAGELDLVHRPAHRLDRGAVGVVLLASAHEAGGGQRRRLGDPDHLQREQLSTRYLELSAELQAAAHQCRKCRFPVNTIAMWWRSATSIAISSRIEPPGWTIAVIPAWAAIWMPSGNGK